MILPKNTYCPSYKITSILSEKKSLPGKDYKGYGMQIVSKSEGFPVRHGENSIRFEVRMGDCNPDHTQEKWGWSDCDNDRERHEIKAGSDKDSMKNGKFWFAWSLYLPKGQGHHRSY